MKKFVSILLSMILVLSISSTALAASEDTTSNTNTIQNLIELKSRLTDAGEISDIDQIIDDVLSGDAILLDSSNMPSASAWSIKRYSDPIKLNGYTLGTFYPVIRFNVDGSYSGLHNYSYTKSSIVTTLDLQSVQHAYYPANNAVVIVQEYYCYMTNPYGNGNFLEIDEIWF